VSGGLQYASGVWRYWYEQPTSPFRPESTALQFPLRIPGATIIYEGRPAGVYTYWNSDLTWSTTQYASYEEAFTTLQTAVGAPSGLEPTPTGFMHTGSQSPSRIPNGGLTSLTPRLRDAWRFVMRWSRYSFHLNPETVLQTANAVNGTGTGLNHPACGLFTPEFGTNAPVWWNGQRANSTTLYVVDTGGVSTPSNPLGNGGLTSSYDCGGGWRTYVYLDTQGRSVRRETSPPARGFEPNNEWALVNQSTTFKYYRVLARGRYPTTGDAQGRLAQQFPLGPCIPDDDPRYSDTGFWQKWYDIAVAAGVMPAGLTFEGGTGAQTADPSTTTYGQRVNSAWVRPVQNVNCTESPEGAFFSCFAIEGAEGRIVVTDGAAQEGNPVIDLALVEPAEGGTLQAFTVDAWGRVVETRPLPALESLACPVPWALDNGSAFGVVPSRARLAECGEADTIYELGAMDAEEGNAAGTCGDPLPLFLGSEGEIITPNEVFLSGWDPYANEFVAWRGEYIGYGANWNRTRSEIFTSSDGKVFTRRGKIPGTYTMSYHINTADNLRDFVAGPDLYGSGLVNAEKPFGTWSRRWHDKDTIDLIWPDETGFLTDGLKTQTATNCCAMWDDARNGTIGIGTDGSRLIHVVDHPTLGTNPGLILPDPDQGFIQNDHGWATKGWTRLFKRGGRYYVFSSVWPGYGSITVGYAAGLSVSDDFITFNPCPNGHSAPIARPAGYNFFRPLSVAWNDNAIVMFCYAQNATTGAWGSLIMRSTDGENFSVATFRPDWEFGQGKFMLICALGADKFIVASATPADPPAPVPPIPGILLSNDNGATWTRHAIPGQRIEYPNSGGNVVIASRPPEYDPEGPYAPFGEIPWYVTKWSPNELWWTENGLDWSPVVFVSGA
jgi:hypothetical protein